MPSHRDETCDWVAAASTHDSIDDAGGFTSIMARSHVLHQQAGYTFAISTQDQKKRLIIGMGPYTPLYYGFAQVALG
jgi:hypothetical protein